MEKAKRMKPEVYGDYCKVKTEAEIANAKKELIDGIKGVIDEVAKRDEFWIVKDWGTCITVGWKIAFPTLLEERGRDVVIKRVAEDGTTEIVGKFER